MESIRPKVNGNGDDLISGDELTECGKKAADFVGISDSSQEFLYNFGVKYWHIVDGDENGSLDFDEFRFTMAAFAVTDAGVALAAYDKNDNSILDEEELTQKNGFFDFVGEVAEQRGMNPHDLQQTWLDAQG